MAEMADGEPGAAHIIDRDEQQATRAAWLYFVAGLTQAQIGKKLGINRIRVNRLLAEARDQGLVQIRITGRMAECVDLEQRLANRFGLDEVIVVPTPGDDTALLQMVAMAAGQALDRRLRDGLSVGVGWGRTLRLSMRSVAARPMPKLSVVSLLGGLTRGAAMNPHETASHLADLLSAQCYYVAAPALTDSEATRHVLMAQPMLREAFERAESVDVALLSVGDLKPGGTMSRVGLIDRDENRSLVEAGAVGDICVHWIDRLGHIVDHPLNRRVVALSPDKLKGIATVILASGGRSKIESLHGALHGGMANVLITDEATAAGVLQLADSLVKPK
jgi:DNA-binding transcriptional regulator LsrR (DeoR family)